MLDWMMGAYSGVKAASDITQSMLALKTDAAVTTKVVELNGVLMGLQSQLYAAQMERAALSGRIAELEAKVASYETWEQEKQRYQLHQFAEGGFAYALTQEMRGSEPTHYICSRCYEDGIKSILQRGNDGWFRALVCHRCSSVVRTDLPPGN